jgi:hypothetical protein
MNKWGRGLLREAWAIMGIWWLIVPGGIFAVVAVIEVVESAHRKTVSFWVALAMAALWMATCVRLGRVLKERDGLCAELALENTRDAVAHRVDRFAREYEMLGAEMPGEQEGVGPVTTSEQINWGASSSHLAEQISSELRQNAPGFVSYWRSNPEPLPPAQLFVPYAESLVAMSLQRLHNISHQLREGHDEPDRAAS